MPNAKQKQHLAELQRQWVDAGSESETNEELAASLRSFIARSVVLQAGLDEKSTAGVVLVKKVLEQLLEPRLGPEQGFAEGAFRRLVQDPEAAVEYIAQNIKIKSDSQAKRARQPRPKRRDAITNKIYEIIGDDPDINNKRVVDKILADKFFKLANQRVVHQPTGASATETAIYSRVIRAKK